MAQGTAAAAASTAAPQEELDGAASAPSRDNESQLPPATNLLVAGEKSALAKVWSGFDTKYMKPFLTHSNPTLMETLPECCLPLARILTSSEQLLKHPAMMHSNERNDFVDVVTGRSNAAGTDDEAIFEHGGPVQPQNGGFGDAHVTSVGAGQHSGIRFFRQ